MSWSTSVSGTPEEIKAQAEMFKSGEHVGGGDRARECAQVDTVVESLLALMAKEGATKASASLYGHAAGAAPQAGDTMGFSYSRME